MKKQLLVMTFLLIFLFSCGKNENVSFNNTTGTGKSIIESSTGELTKNETVITYNNETGTGNNTETGTGKIILLEPLEPQELSIDEKLALLKSKEEIIKELKNSDDGSFLEELPRLNSYYKDNAFHEFYILNSIKTNDINECNKIPDEGLKQLCTSIFTNRDDENKFLGVFLSSGGELDYGKSFYRVINNIKNNVKTCENDNITSYLQCKKILDKDYDVEETFMNYNILRLSRMNDVKNYYKEIGEYWGMDNGFLSLIKIFNIETGVKEEGFIGKSDTGVVIER